jgi:hypothetical protein
LPTLEKQNLTFFEAAGATCKTSGSDAPGTPREERLAGNQNER